LPIGILALMRTFRTTMPIGFAGDAPLEPGVTMAGIHSYYI